MPTGTDPHEAALSDGHWMIDVGVTGEIMPDSPHALERFGATERVALHVNGGDGPLLLTQTAAVVEYFDYSFPEGIVVYDASPVL